MAAASDGGLSGDRIEYGDAPLRRRDLARDPFELFTRWLAEARAAGVSEPSGMALATCDTEGQPHCRIVLLKHWDAHGLLFFTNARSDKGDQLAANARAAATFWWPAPRNRQVRFIGSVHAAASEVSDRYFAERPRRAQICSAASPQSRPVADRAELERLVDAEAARVGDGPVARPEHWGGFVLVPLAVELWQGRDGRLHDRFRYRRLGPTLAEWTIERLAP